MIAGLQKRLAEQQLSFHLTDRAKTYVIDEGFDPVYGARPLRRFIQQKVETLLARRIIEGGLTPGADLTVDYNEAEQKLVIASPAEA